MVTVGFLLRVVAVIGINTLRRLDHGARVPVAEVALLRSLPHFAELPVTALETLAEAADRVEAEPGQMIIRQGQQGERLYPMSTVT